MLQISHDDRPGDAPPVPAKILSLWKGRLDFACPLCDEDFWIFPVTSITAGTLWTCSHCRVLLSVEP